MGLMRYTCLHHGFAPGDVVNTTPDHNEIVIFVADRHRFATLPDRWYWRCVAAILRAVWFVRRTLWA